MNMVFVWDNLCLFIKNKLWAVYQLVQGSLQSLLVLSSLFSQYHRKLKNFTVVIFITLYIASSLFLCHTN